MDTLGKIPEGDAWDDAYNKVEHYLISLQLKNRRVISRLVYFILEKAVEKSKYNSHFNPTSIAMEEAYNLTTNWCEKVLGVKFDQKSIPIRGRVAMLLANLPEKWPQYFLNDGPWPKELIDSMKETYVKAGPDLQISRMKHRALEFTSAGSILAETFKFVNRQPYAKLIIYFVIAIAFILLFFLTR
jgi:hypothetical protein